MKIYGHPYSSNARRVQMLCEEIGLPYSYDTVDLLAGKQYDPAFLSMNPNGKVPVIDDDGFLMWESQAILRYLADKNGAQDWYPKDLQARARVDQWLDWHQTRLSPPVSKIAFNTLFVPEDKRDLQAMEAGRKDLTKILPVLDAALKGKAHVCGATPTLADLAMSTTFGYLSMCNYDLSPYAEITRWYRGLQKRPSFTKTAPQ